MGFGCSPEPILTTGMPHRSTARPPLLKFIYLVCPAFDLSENRLLPGAVSDSLRPTPATAPTRFALVVSHHLDDLLRFRARIYCNTIPNRVRCVSPPNLLSSKAETSPTGDSRIPTAQFTPLKEFPSPAAVPCHHGRCHSCRLPTQQVLLTFPRCQVSQTTTKHRFDTSQELYTQKRALLWSASNPRTECPKTSLHKTTAARRLAEARRTNTEMLVFTGRLQGFTPPASPYCVDCFQYRHSLFFHGLCSPPRCCSFRFVPTTSRRSGRTTKPKPLVLHRIPPLVSRASRQASQHAYPRSLFESTVFHRL